MSNYFKREPFVTLASGKCAYHPERKASYKVFLPYMDPKVVCRDCKDFMLERRGTGANAQP